MAFKDDHGGFQFSCDNGKISLDASTWSTRLSQLGKWSGEVWIMTRHLNDVEYIAGILGKRPKDIYIIAHESARIIAAKLKARFPEIRIALHNDINAKAVLVEPQTIWISSADFGRTEDIESTIGVRSIQAYENYLNFHVKMIWCKSIEI